jgi:hypothetical protein
MQSKKPQGTTKKHGDWLRCSFCKKHADEVAELIAGPHVHICNSCVDLCRSILKTDHPEYKPLREVQSVEVPLGPIKVSEVIALLAKYHFDTKVEITIREVS